MRKKVNRAFFGSILVGTLLLTGCGGSGSDAGDEKNALVQQGLEKAQQKQWVDAVSLFQEALDSNPRLARADLEMALIYHQQLKDYIRAVYHYERYLEKRPESQKRQLIDGWIRQAKIALAAETGQSGDGVSAEIIRLKKENEMLRRQMARGGAPKAACVKTLLTEPPKRKPAPKPAVKPAPAPAVAKQPTPISTKPIPRIQTSAPAQQTYKVLPGETLSSIARKVYGNSSKYNDIFLANQDTMKSENDLKAGQVIIIPRR